MSVHLCLSVLLSLSHIVCICTDLSEQINDDDDALHQTTQHWPTDRGCEECLQNDLIFVSRGKLNLNSVNHSNVAASSQSAQLLSDLLVVFFRMNFQFSLESN